MGMGFVFWLIGFIWQQLGIIDVICWFAQWGLKCERIFFARTLIRQAFWRQCFGIFWLDHADLAMAACARTFVMLPWCHWCCGRRIWIQQEEEESDKKDAGCRRRCA